ncbi:hypothetical protein DSO57_1004148 [Entomophthora muscae]|uniref:Uncharacterized protein n=1 Tax=Entomophthora muscae TaxID=34485 RepID=A0ACC2UH67_9FUNG|nr:hypothetical protein DSO57_1004148 [Entomophthora muscae]
MMKKQEYENKKQGFSFSASPVADSAIMAKITYPQKNKQQQPAQKKPIKKLDYLDQAIENK